jgi:hypothetical protein
MRPKVDLILETFSTQNSARQVCTDPTRPDQTRPDQTTRDAKTMSKAQSPYDSLRHIAQYYDNTDSHNSALNLILTLRPEWRDSKDTIEFVRFTDGITNTVCAPTPLSLHHALHGGLAG